MKKIINHYMSTFALCSVMLFSSCSGFLNMQPSNSANSENAIATPADAQVIVNGIMRAMTSSSYYGRNFFMYGDAKGGDLTIISQGRGLDDLYTFNHTATSGNYSGFWEQGYYCIMQINNLLENIDKLETAGKMGFDSYKGQALTLRGLIYFDLVRLYGLPYNYNNTGYGVPLVTKTLDSDAEPTRATVKEIYTQILSDLSTGATLLSKDKSLQNGYIGYYGNLAEQARVKLYIEDYDGALAAAKEIINSGVYTLYTPDKWIASWATQFGSESIFELGMYPNEGDLGTSSLGFYLMCEGQMDGAAGWFMGSDSFLNKLSEDKSDVRWGVMGQDESTTLHLGSCYKYMGGLSVAGDGKESITAVNIKVVRLSEVYLIASEAALHATIPDAAKAAVYLNDIRCRAPQLTPATAATISDDMILDERSKELFCEGQRFFDMIRMNKSITFDDEFGGIAVSHRTKTIDRTFGKIVLPISQDEINANPALKSEQNDAYK